MESEYFLTDKNGQRIDNLQKYYDENPEILKKHIERLNENNNLEPSESLFNPEKVKLLIEVHEVGVFRKAFKSFYLNWLNEIHAHSENEKFLLEQKEKAQDFIDESNNEIIYRPDNLIIKKNGKYVITTMESVQNKISQFLSRLEREKAKGDPKRDGGEKANKRAVNVCVGNVEMNKPTFQKMLTKMNELFFDNSEIDQWESIIKNASPTQPIRVKKTTSIVDLRLFFDLLSENEIFESEYLTPLINLKAFFLDNPKQNKILEYDQLKQAKKYINKRKIKPKFSIDDFFSVIE